MLHPSSNQRCSVGMERGKEEGFRSWKSKNGAHKALTSKNVSPVVLPLSRGPSRPPSSSTICSDLHRPIRASEHDKLRKIHISISISINTIACSFYSSKSIRASRNPAKRRRNRKKAKSHSPTHPSTCTPLTNAIKCKSVSLSSSPSGTRLWPAATLL